MSEPVSTSHGTGLAPNVAGALAYALGPVTGIVLLVVEPEDRFVRFHAAQSVVVSAAISVGAVALSLATAVLAVIPVLGWLVAALLYVAFGAATLGLWVWLMVQAYQRREWEVPGVGAWVRRLAAPGSLRAG